MTIISNILQPSVAGSFYPANSIDLQETLKNLFEKARAEQKTNIKNRFQALIAPHAAYKYSGLTSAHAYKNFWPAYYNNVLVLAPVHQKHCEGLFIYPQTFYESPLGISPRQDISLHSGIKLSEELFENEHAAEVHLPFLQYRLLEEGLNLKSYPITLMLYGQIHPQKLAKKLQNLLTDKTLLILSSDLSHYHNLKTASQKDELAIEAMLSGDPEKVMQVEACGRIGISAFLRTKQANLCQADFLHYSHSGQVNEDQNKVVGYTAIGFSASSKKKTVGEIVEVFLHSNVEKSLNQNAQKDILGFLHFCLKDYLSSKKIPDTSPLAQKYPQLTEEGACFITLHSNNNLRGCIGSLQANKPLHQDLVINCLKAACEDPRFEPLTLNELSDIKIEISLLKNVKFLRCRNEFDLLNSIEPHKHGVILKQGNKTATFLPQVWDKTPNKLEFLNQLSRKAGFKSPDAWKIPRERIQIYTYEVFSFQDI